MGFESVLREYFPAVHTEVDFVKKTYAAFKGRGFSDENSIASVCVCRDEISQSMRSVVKHLWGEAFNLSSLAGMFFAGKTGLRAAMHHAPVVGGRERYVFYAMPHVAVDAAGRIGACRREGRDGDSIACGALSAFQKEMASGKLNISMDNEDVEQSLVRMRLLREISYGRVPDLLELTRVALAAVQADLENTIKAVVDPEKSDYAVATGIQIHGPEGNYVWPASCYCVVEGKKTGLAL